MAIKRKSKIIMGLKDATRPISPTIALAWISGALFPAPRKGILQDAYYELEGVRQDMKHRPGCGDEICIATIERVQAQIQIVRRILRKAGVELD